LSKFIVTLIILLGCAAASGATFKDGQSEFAEVCASGNTSGLTKYLCEIDGHTINEKPRSNLLELIVRMSGEIKPGDDKQLVNGYLQRLKKGGTLMFYISSEGGDVHTAIQIGRLLRQYAAHVYTTGKCLSSCVLVVIGGVDRTVATHAGRGSGIGLHRPYFGSLPPDLSAEEITQRRELLRTEVSTYIKEMNVTSRLLDLMEAVPPEKMKMLSESEVSDLGLDVADPVWDEQKVAKSASYYGITSAEYRQRKVNAEAKCQIPLHENLSAEDAQNRIDCKEATLYKITIKDYWLRNERYEVWKKAYAVTALRTPDGKFTPAVQAFGLKCLLNIMNFNAQTCDK